MSSNPVQDIKNQNPISPSFPLKYILCYYKCALKARVQEFNE